MRTISRAGVMRRRKNNRYTIGLYLAAVAAASVRMLARSELIQRIEIEISEGIQASFDLIETVMNEDYAECSAINGDRSGKDAVAGIKVSARSQWVLTNHQNERLLEGIDRATASNDYENMILEVGKGIGIVTKPGLCVSVGQHAIHPEVTETIKRKTEEYVPAGKIVKIILSVSSEKRIEGNSPDRRLGITGGISIFDAVETMRDSPESKSLKIATMQVGIALALGLKTIAVALDKKGVEAAIKFLKFEEDAVILVEDNIAEFIDYCVNKGIKEIITIGCLSKILLIADGALEIEKHKKHNKKETIEILKGIIREHTKDVAPLYFMMNARSVEEAASALERMGQAKLLDAVARRATEAIKSTVDHNIEIGTVAVESTGHILAADKSAREIQRRANKT